MKVLKVLDRLAADFIEAAAQVGRDMGVVLEKKRGSKGK